MQIRPVARLAARPMGVARNTMRPSESIVLARTKTAAGSGASSDQEDKVARRR